MSCTTPSSTSATRSSHDLREALPGPPSCSAGRRPPGVEDRDLGWCLRPWRVRDNAARSSNARIAALRAVTGVGPEMTSRAPRATRTVASSRVHTFSCLIARSQTARSISLPRWTLERGRDPATPTLMRRRPRTGGRPRARETQTQPWDHLHALVTVSWRSRSLPGGEAPTTYLRPSPVPRSLSTATTTKRTSRIDAARRPNKGRSACVTLGRAARRCVERASGICAHGGPPSFPLPGAGPHSGKGEKGRDDRRDRQRAPARRLAAR
jgi:hypothetical protein